MDQSNSQKQSLGADLVHNHVRPETADAAVMVKAASKKLSQRPISAEPLAYEKSVEEELELTSRNDSLQLKGNLIEIESNHCWEREKNRFSSLCFIRNAVLWYFIDQFVLWNNL